MEAYEHKFSSVISKIKQHQPEPEDAAGLTDDIMQKVRNLPRTQAPKTLVWFRVISGAAAIFLVGLFLFQPEVSEVKTTNSGSALLHFRKSGIDSACFQGTKLDESNLLKTYACYLKKNTIENNRFKSIKQSSEN